MKTTLAKQTYAEAAVPLLDCPLNESPNHPKASAKHGGRSVVANCSQRSVHNKIAELARRAYEAHLHSKLSKNGFSR